MNVDVAASTPLKSYTYVGHASQRVATHPTQHLHHGTRDTEALHHRRVALTKKLRGRKNESPHSAEEKWDTGKNNTLCCATEKEEEEREKHMTETI